MSVISIAASGMTAAMAQLNVSAQNVANSQTDGALSAAPSTASASPPPANASPQAYAPLQLAQFSLPLSQGGGVQTQITNSANPYQTAYDPSASYANSQGLVAAPNVDPVTEAVNQISALNQFKASASLLKAGEDLMKTTLDLIS